MAFPLMQVIQKATERKQGGDSPSTNLRGAGFAGIQGLSQIARGRQLLRQSEAATPETQSRQLLQQQTLLDRQRRSLQTGTATRRQSEMFAQAFKTGATQSFRGGGGTRGLNQLTQMFNQGVTGLSSQSQQQQIALLQQRGQVADTLAAQERELGLLKQAKLEARGEQLLKTGRSNATAAVTTALSGGFQGKESQPAGQGFDPSKVNQGGQTSASSAPTITDDQLGQGTAVSSEAQGFGFNEASKAFGSELPFTLPNV